MCSHEHRQKLLGVLNGLHKIGKSGEIPQPALVNSDDAVFDPACAVDAPITSEFPKRIIFICPFEGVIANKAVRCSLVTDFTSNLGLFFVHHRD
jgi:hypothetical protein